MDFCDLLVGCLVVGLLIICVRFVVVWFTCLLLSYWVVLYSCVVVVGYVIWICVVTFVVYVRGGLVWFGYWLLYVCCFGRLVVCYICWCFDLCLFVSFVAFGWILDVLLSVVTCDFCLIERFFVVFIVCYKFCICFCFRWSVCCFDWMLLVACDVWFWMLLVWFVFGLGLIVVVGFVVACDLLVCLLLVCSGLVCLNAVYFVCWVVCLCFDASLLLRFVWVIVFINLCCCLFVCGFGVWWAHDFTF